jgi:hypothetical protein
MIEIYIIPPGIKWADIMDEEKELEKLKKTKVEKPKVEKTETKKKRHRKKTYDLVFD